MRRGVALAITLASCSSTPVAPGVPACTPGGDGSYVDTEYDTLSAYCMVTVQNAHIVPRPGVMPYAPNGTLFSDYAVKSRTAWVPKGTTVAYDPQKPFDMPVGSILTKSFGLPADLRNPEPVRWIETRLLLRTADGWKGISYVWDDDQKEARIRPGGETRDVAFVKMDGSTVTSSYLVPNQNQCKKCHADVDTVVPIGVRADELNGEFAYDDGKENQLARWSRVGLLTGAPQASASPFIPSWADTSLPQDVRARAYLAANCAHCHSEVGEARTTGLDLGFAETDPYRLGACKSPVAAGQATGTLTYDVVPGNPDASILLFRMLSTTPAIAMPEIGRSLVHDEGVALVRAWITGLPGDCSAPPK
jgi:uncharacterized repeat protein (TIGR03806 family)